MARLPRRALMAHLAVRVWFRCSNIYTAWRCPSPFSSLSSNFFDPERQLGGNCLWLNARAGSSGRRINRWPLPKRRGHSSHLSARISGLVTSRANLLQRSVTLNSPSASRLLVLGCLSPSGAQAGRSGTLVNEWRQRPPVEPLPFKVATLHWAKIDTKWVLNVRNPCGPLPWCHGAI